jgi:quercetin dioxygenase-like cupin family protein
MRHPETHVATQPEAGEQPDSVPTTLRDAVAFLLPGAGKAIRTGSMSVVYKVSAEWTGGAYTMHEQPVGPKVMVAPHTHAAQDQVSYVVEGELGFLVGEEEFVAPTGSCIFRPRGVRHALWNATDKPARMLEITNPGGQFECYFLRFGELTEAGETSQEVIHALGARYGISYDLDKAEDLAQRYGVSSSGSWWAGPRAWQRPASVPPEERVH